MEKEHLLIHKYGSTLLNPELREIKYTFGLAKAGNKSTTCIVIYKFEAVDSQIYEYLPNHPLQLVTFLNNHLNPRLQNA